MRLCSRCWSEHRIGAVVVSVDGSDVAGIVSERDIVRHLHSTGAACSTARSAQIMTTEVTTCGRDDDLEDLARTMTELRVRHCRSSGDGRLTAIVSIGDIVKHRLYDPAVRT